MKKHLHNFGSFYARHRKILVAVKVIAIVYILAGVFTLQFQDGKFFHGSAPTYASLTFDCSTVTDITQAECESLKALYNATNGDGRYNTGNRGVTTTVCGNWYGVYCSMSNVYYLSLSSNNLSGTLPGGVLSGLSNLQYLYLNGNYISRIESGAFMGLSGLMQASLGYNNIESIASNAFSGASSLNYLTLNNNRITTIESGAFAGLSSLPELQLNYNLLTGIENGAFIGLSNLTSLYIINNALSFVESGDFEGLPNLQGLYLNNNYITGIESDDFYGLPSLTTLYLSRNRLSSIDSGVFNVLTGLTWLSLYDNNLTGVEIGDFNNITSLNNLELGYNAISSIEDGAFSGLVNLQYLGLLGNLLTGFANTTFTGLPVLQTLDLQQNRIQSVDDTDLDELSTLTDLRLNHNQLTGVEVGDLDSLPNLQRIQLNNNQIVSIESGAFSGLPSLNYINLSVNLVTGIENGDFAYLPALGTLYFNYNQIAIIESGAWSGMNNLSYLALDHNQIISMDNSIFSGTTPNLNYLGLQNNQMDRLPYSLTGLLSLSLLYVNYNQLCTGYMPQSFLAFVNSKAEFNRQTTQDTSGCILLDADGDGIGDYSDNCRLVPNPGQENINGMTMIPITLSGGNPEYTFPNGAIVYFTDFGMINIASSGSTAEFSSNGSLRYTSRSPMDMRQRHYVRDTSTHTIIEISGAAFNRMPPTSIYFEFGSGDTIGNACDCTDSICTTGMNVSGALICSPADPACPAATCGNSIIEGGEQCDNANLSGKSCASFGYSKGTLSCSASCAFNTSNCSNPSGGGGGGDHLTSDNCPDGDYSPSYYDHICGQKPTATHAAATTTGFESRIIRKELAKMVVPFAEDILKLEPKTGKQCFFSDIKNETTGDQAIIKTACQLEVMGMRKDGISLLIRFKPNAYVTRNQFIAVISRLLYSGKNNVALTSPIIRYTNHDKALQRAQLLASIPARITASVVAHIFKHIQENPDMIQR